MPNSSDLATTGRISIASRTALTVKASAPTGMGAGARRPPHYLIVELGALRTLFEEASRPAVERRGAGGHFDEPGNIERPWRWMQDRAFRC